MSTSPDRGENRIVNLLSHWLARHVDDEELVRELDGVEPASLSQDQAQAVEELREELAGDPSRAQLEVAVRETLEALALGA
jgi:hypothetical protein